MKTLVLKTAQEEFEALHVALDTVRSTSTTVKVPREALAHILADHGTMWGKLTETTQITDGESNDKETK